MAEVKKREKIPEIFEITPKPESPEDIKISVGKKDYPVPNLTLKQYKKILKMLNEKDLENLTELENLEFTQDFYYQILKFEHPELKRADLDDMPLCQYNAEFIIKMKMALFRAPLVS